MAEARDAVFEEAFGGVFVFDAVGVCGIVVLEAKFFAFGDAVRLDDTRSFL